MNLINLMHLEIKDFTNDLEHENFFSFKRELESLLYLSYSKVLISSYQVRITKPEFFN